MVIRAYESRTRQVLVVFGRANAVAPVDNPPQKQATSNSTKKQYERQNSTVSFVNLTPEDAIARIDLEKAAQEGLAKSSRYIDVLATGVQNTGYTIVPKVYDSRGNLINPQSRGNSLDKKV